MPEKTNRRQFIPKHDTTQGKSLFSKIISAILGSGVADNYRPGRYRGGKSGQGQDRWQAKREMKKKIRRKMARRSRRVNRGWRR